VKAIKVAGELNQFRPQIQSQGRGDLGEIYADDTDGEHKAENVGLEAQ